MLSGSSCPCEEDSEFPGLSLPSACWLFKTMGSSCELVKLWNVTKDAAQSQMAPISPSNANKVSWKEGRLTHTTMHRMIYINNICTAAGTFAHKSSHTPSTATIHFPYRYTHHLYINIFILTENMQTNSWRVPSVLWDISSCSLHNTLGLINIHIRACPRKCSKLTSFILHPSEFASSSHPLVMLQWYWWDFWRSLWAFSFLPHHPLCSAPLKDQSQRLISPFMKDLTFIYLTPQLFINSVCFNWKFG